MNLRDSNGKAALNKYLADKETKHGKRTEAVAPQKGEGKAKGK